MLQEKLPIDPTPNYGFSRRLHADFPSQVVADTTEVCNLACVHCTHPAFKKSEHYRARMLSPALNAKMIDEVKEHGRGRTLYVRYSGNGEPLLHPHIYTMLDYAVREAGTTITLTSNGTLLNESRTEKLLATRVNLVDISLDAFRPETYARIRVQGDLAVTRENVRRLIRRAAEVGGRTKVVVSFIEQPENTAEIPEFENFWRGEGAEQVVVRRLHTNANSTANVVAQRPAVSTPRRPCLYPWERILITPTGHLAFCPQDWVHASEIANYEQTTIHAVWQGATYRKLREAHLSGNYSCHGFCGQCPDWATTRWPGQGKSYADLVETVQARPA